MKPNTDAGSGRTAEEQARASSGPDDSPPETAIPPQRIPPPGASVEVRIPPFAAVQCISGPRHTRGTPPNVAETDPRTWLLLSTGLHELSDATASGALRLSGSRAGELAGLLPLVKTD